MTRKISKRQPERSQVVQRRCPVLAFEESPPKRGTIPQESKGCHELPQSYRAKSWVQNRKTDSRDALHILDLLLTNRFPRMWVPTPAERDVHQLLRHRHKLVGYRTSVMNRLHALAMSQGLCRKRKLWSRMDRQELEPLPYPLVRLRQQATNWVSRVLVS